MLPRYNQEIMGSAKPKILKTVSGEDRSRLGAFPEGESLTLTVKIPRRLGEGGVALRLYPDGEGYRDIPFSFSKTELGVDDYSLTLDLPKGLYYWELIFVRGYDTLFTSTENNVDFSLERESGGKFRLLIYDKDFKAPDWFAGGIMYQIFPDRFARAEGGTAKRKDAVIRDDWDGDIEQYADMPGGDVENNEFFGGSLDGVIEKLDYLESLGVTVIYLNPIFKAYSNHRYDTGDYERIDRMLGGSRAFSALVSKAKKKGMRVILDGVFNHTGSDSRYFDKKGTYGGGAYSDENSPYREWYNFRSYPDDYECWWGIKILPRLNHEKLSCRRYFTGEGGIAEKYIKQGAAGWRLDVADELSDEFLDEFRDRVKEASNGQAIIIGEVWENAADKIAYGKRRRYLMDGQLDSVMNYPLRNAIIDFMLTRNAELLYNTLTEIYASYPEHVSNSLMNLLGTHDTERILTVLGAEDDGFALTNAERAEKRLDQAQYAAGIRLLKLAAVIQYTVYGVPSIYYGDEAGLEGYGDPFCRRPYPWGKEDRDLLDFYRLLGNIRASHDCFKNGSFVSEYIGENIIKITRKNEQSCILTAVSRAHTEERLSVDGEYVDLLTGKEWRDSVMLAPDSAVILLKK